MKVSDLDCFPPVPIHTFLDFLLNPDDQSQTSCLAELNEERPSLTWLGTEGNEMLVNRSELSCDLMKGPQSDLNLK